MSPERLLKEPWRLAVFFTVVFGVMIVCIATILWQQELGTLGTSRTQQLILLALQKSDRNNQTGLEAIKATRQVYEAGEKARGQLMAMVAQEKQMNISLIRMNRDSLNNQRWMRKHIQRLERRRR